LSFSFWTGSTMLLWGGFIPMSPYPGSTATNMGAVFNPAAKTWYATSLAGAPTARSYASAIWTGSEMILWGGSETTELGTKVTNAGARYQP